MYRGAPTGAGARSIGSTRVVHPAIRHLPPPSGTSQVAFRDAPSGGATAQEEEVQARHQAAEPFSAHGAFQPPKREAGTTYTKEQMSQWQYPEYDASFDDPKWLKEQFRKEREDPRENANFYLDPSDPEFFNNAARRPYAKALLRSEEHFNTRKNLWLEQFDNVRLMNDSRGFVGASLEQCAAEIKRLVAPMLKYRIVEILLMHVEQRAKELNVPFEEQIEDAEHKDALQDFRRTADSSGARGMEDLFRAWEFRCTRQHLENQAKEERELRLKGGAIGTMEELKDSMVEASKCKQDGVVEWSQGNVEDAIASWRKGHKVLYKVRAPDTHMEENKARNELHIALLKNLAQAAIKLGNWNEALEAADMAVVIDDQDHKAWFRKACALEGLGRLAEVERCLIAIDGIAVGRPDRDRIQQDTQTKREKIKTLANRDEASQKRMLQGGVKHALFSEERSTQAPALEARAGPPLISHKVKVVDIDDKTRKRLTKEAAEDLLGELKEAYGDATFRKQVRKLAQDVNDQGEFIAYLNKVAIHVQKPVLERFGFAPNDVGVTEMRRAVQDHTKAKDSDPKMRALAEETLQALYGDFYEVVRGVGLHPELRAPEARARRKADDGGGGGSSGSDAEAGVDAEALPPCLHWTGRPLSYMPGLTADERVKAEELQARRLRPICTRPGEDTEASRLQRMLREDGRRGGTAAMGSGGGARRGGAAGAGLAVGGGATGRSTSGAGGEEEGAGAPATAAARPRVTAAERKEIWSELGKAMAGTDAAAMRAVVDRAVQAGFSAITIRSAKKRLEALGGDVSDLQ